MKFQLNFKPERKQNSRFLALKDAVLLKSKILTSMPLHFSISATAITKRTT